MTTEALVERLMAAIDGVTPGPWFSEEDGGDEFTAFAVFTESAIRYGGHPSICDTHNSGSVVLEQDDGRPWDEQGRKDMAYIALCSPDNIGQLLSELTRLREALEAKDAELEASMETIARERERADANAEHARLANTNFKQMDAARAAALARAEKAEAEVSTLRAKLDEAEKALEQVVAWDNATLGDFLPKFVGMLARATLTKLRSRS